MAKWAVAMSGGVDRAGAAALLAAEGHEVVGLTMNLWPDWLPEPDDAFKACCGVSAIEDARAVARHLGIRHYVLSMREEFEHAVIEYFVDAYARGRTPNPCIACNQAIKFSLLLRKVTALGLDGVATGHYPPPPPPPPVSPPAGPGCAQGPILRAVRLDAEAAGPAAPAHRDVHEGRGPDVGARLRSARGRPALWGAHGLRDELDRPPGPGRRAVCHRAGTPRRSRRAGEGPPGCGHHGSRRAVRGA